MISYEQAQAIIRELRFAPTSERVPLERALGRVLAEDLTALVSSPPFTNSAMDGFGICCGDLGGRLGPFPVLGTVLARPTQDHELPTKADGAYAAVRVMTGARLPPWVDAVVPVENATVNGAGQVSFTALPAPGTNVRAEGADLAKDSLLMRQGTELDPERIMVAAAFGHRDLAVRAKPQLVIVSTGDELVEPGTVLQPGAIYNSSKYFLLAAAAAAGFADAQYQFLADDIAQARPFFEGLLKRDRPVVLITTGAVSAGDADFLPRLGKELGFETLFHQVAIRPGKPIYLARQGQVIWLGLPGNPISTCVGWHAFVRPLLSAAAFAAPQTRRTLILKNEVRKPEELRCFFRAEVSGNRAWVPQRQGSSHFAASMTTEAYVELPEGFSRIPAETRVEAIIV